MGRNTRKYQNLSGGLVELACQKSEKYLKMIREILVLSEKWKRVQTPKYMKIELRPWKVCDSIKEKTYQEL